MAVIYASNILQRVRDRFWSHVDQRGGSDACWPWQLKLNKKGYGRFKFDGRTERANRVALALKLGKLDVHEWALHSCDYEACCNPLHLRAGGHQDNVNDRVAREGYRTMPSGDNHWLRRAGAVHWTQRPEHIGKIKAPRRNKELRQ